MALHISKIKTLNGSHLKDTGNNVRTLAVSIVTKSRKVSESHLVDLIVEIYTESTHSQTFNRNITTQWKNKAILELLRQEGFH